MRLGHARAGGEFHFRGDELVTRLSDPTPEQKAASMARAYDAIERADAMLESLAERAERREADGSAAAERHAERERQREERDREERERVAAEQQPQPKPAPAQQAATMDPTTAARWNNWADGRIWAAIKKYSDQLAEEILDHLQERFTRGRGMTNDSIQAVEDRLTKSEVATVELITELERRLAALEERAVVKPIKPKLVTSDAGD
jgi:hypothetical protein